MQRPLTDDVARPARSYLAALLPADEVSDAWHELLDDAAYWGERDLRPVLRLAHQVVLQHERVTPEVAALVLADLGVDDPADVAHVLDTDEATARQWAAQAEASREGDVAPPPAAPLGRFADPARTPAAAEGRPVPPADAPEPPTRVGGVATEVSTPAREASAPATTAPAPATEQSAPATEVAAASPGGAVRIGFEDDHPLPGGAADDSDGDRPRVTTRGIVAIALLLWVVVVVLWVLAR